MVQVRSLFTRVLLLHTLDHLMNGAQGEEYASLAKEKMQIAVRVFCGCTKRWKNWKRRKEEAKIGSEAG